MNAVFTLFNFSDLKMHVERKGKKKRYLFSFLLQWETTFF